jgi:hypothetical protein
MIQRIISFAIILFFLVSCEKEPDIKEFPIITTLNPINVNETGATFRGELVKEGKNKTSSYGFTWSIQEPNINTSEKIVLGDELPEGVFETRINSSLAKGFEYKIRTFTTYGDKIVYGNTITLMSKGSEKSPWTKELSGISIEGWGTPYGWSDEKNGYVIFQNAKAYKFDPEKVQFSRIADFPESGNSGTRYTSIAINNIQYVFSDIDNNLYQFDGEAWSIRSNTPFYYGYFGGYYHGYSTLNQIFLLSSTQSFSYNPEASLWQTKSVMPAQNYSIGGTDLNGFAYVMDCGKYINKYNPQEDNWQYISTFPGNFPEGSVNFNRYDGKIIGFSHDNIIFFGFCYSEYAPNIEESIWGYNLTTNSWKEIETFPEDLNSDEIFYFYLKGKLYIGHGNSGNYDIYSLDTSKL